MPIAIVVFGAQVSGTLLAAIAAVVIVLIAIAWYVGWYLPSHRRR
jgi:hypothetical protein